MATDSGAPTEHEDPQTFEDAEEAGPDASHGPGHRAAEEVGPDGDEHDHQHDHDHDHGSAGQGSHALSAHGHDGPDADDHLAEDPRWVLLPLAAGLIIGVVVLLIVASTVAP